MTEQEKSRSSKRAEQHEAMLREALRRPGVREVMEVYDAWQRTDHGLDANRAATKKAVEFTTTDHANARTP